MQALLETKGLTISRLLLARKKSYNFFLGCFAIIRQKISDRLILMEFCRLKKNLSNGMNLPIRTSVRLTELFSPMRIGKIVKNVSKGGEEKNTKKFTQNKKIG